MKLYPQFLVAISANGGAFIFGTLLGWSAPTAAIITENEDYKFWVTKNQFSWIVANLALGAFFSCVLSGIVRSRIGTKHTIFLFSIPLVVGWGLITFPANVSMLMIGRFLCGVSAGCYSYVLPIYVGEISSNEIRGSMLSIFQIGFNLGAVLVFVVGHFASLLVLNIVCGTIAIAYTIGICLLPESPLLSISQNRECDAEKSLKLLRGDSFNIEAEMSLLKLQNSELQAQKKSFAKVFSTKSTSKAFVIIMLQFFFFQMSGVNIVMFYSTTIFIKSKIALEPDIASIIVVVCQAATTLIALGFVDRFGRKVLLGLSNTFMIIGLAGIGTYFTLSDAGINVEWIDWLPLTSLIVFVVAFSMGVGPLTYILSGELFLQDAKVFVAPIGQTFNFFLTFVMGLLFPLMTQTIGSGPTFFIFSGFCVLALIFTVLLVPETRGKSTAAIQNMLSR